MSCEAFFKKSFVQIVLVSVRNYLSLLVWVKSVFSCSRTLESTKFKISLRSEVEQQNFVFLLYSSSKFFSSKTFKMTVQFFLLLLVFLLNRVFFSDGQNDLIKIREWKKLDFKFPNVEARSEAIRTRRWIPENAFPIDVDVDYYGNKGEKWLKFSCSLNIFKAHWKVQEFSWQFRDFLKAFLSHSAT